MAVGGSFSMGVGAAARPTAAQLTQYINLSNYAYSSGLVPFSPTLESKLGFKPLTNANGSLVAKFDNDTGFYGQAFISTGTGPKKMIVAFEGTNISNPPSQKFLDAQIGADALIFAGRKATSFQQALDFTNQAITAGTAAGVSTRSNMFVTGHSLGAAQAEYAASYTGLGGATFGTPALSTKVSGPYKNPALFNYVNNGDPVGNYAANPPRYMGQIVQANNIRHVGTTTLVGSYFNSLPLQAAAYTYAKHTVLGDIATVGALALGADLFHPLKVYANALNIKLYEGDRTQGSGSRFFDPILPSGKGAFAAPAASRNLQEFTSQLFSAAFTGGVSNTGAGRPHGGMGNSLGHFAASSFLPQRR